MIEKDTRQKIEKMSLPTGEQISDKRVIKFKEDIVKTIQEQKDNLGKFRKLIDNMAIEQALDMTDIAAALAYIGQEEQPLFPKMEPLDVNAGRSERRERNNDRGDRNESSRSRDRSERRDGSFADREAPEEGMERYYLGVGRMDNVSPRDIVGAIANEANLESKYIGHIKLFEKFSTVDLPEAMPEEILQDLRRMTIKNRPSKIRLMTDEPPPRKSFDDNERGGFRRDRSERRDRGDRGSRFDRDSKRDRKPFRGDDQPPRKTRRFGRH